MNKLFFNIAIGIGFSSGVFAQGEITAQEHKLLLQGNSAYANKDFAQAESAYQQILQENKGSLKGNYNLGNSLYKNQEFSKAIEYYNNAAQSAPDNFVKAKALYNMGNAHLQLGESQEKQMNEMIKSGALQQNLDQAKQLYQQRQDAYKNARDAYKEALRANPQDYDAKNNLAYAQRKLQQIQQEQQQQQQQEQQQQNQNQDNQQNQDSKNQNQPPQPPKNEKEEQDQKQKTEPVQSGNSNPNAPQQLSQDEVQRLLQIIDNEDKKVQEKLLQQAQGNRTIPDKDW